MLILIARVETMLVLCGATFKTLPQHQLNPHGSLLMEKVLWHGAG